MINKPLVLVTGATGTVGPRVVAALLESSCRVRTFSLDALPLPGYWPDGVDVRQGDIIDTAAVRLAMQGVNAVIHLAALLHIVNPPPEMREKYQRINVEGTARVVDAAVRAGVDRVVFFSTIAVYGASAESVLTEESPLRPDSFYAQTKADAERIVLSAKCKDGPPLGTVLRLGAVYGPRIKGNYQRLVQSIARGRFIPVGSGTNRRTLVYDRDVARAALCAIMHTGAAGNIFNVSDGHFHTMTEIIKTICNVLERRPPLFAIPVSPVRRMAGFLEDGYKLLGRSSPVTRGMIDKFTEDIAVDSRRIQTMLGFVPQYDLAAGWKETIQEMRDVGNL